MTTFLPIDENGESACYNECSQLYLKQDTLINLCGGYTFYLMKAYDDIKEFNGAGTSTQELVLKEGAKEAKVSYEFFKDLDQLTIEDQNGNKLFETAMISTNAEQSVTIPLKNITTLALKIKSQSSDSRWKIKVEN